MVDSQITVGYELQDLMKRRCVIYCGLAIVKGIFTFFVCSALRLFEIMLFVERRLMILVVSLGFIASVFTRISFKRFCVKINETNYYIYTRRKD